MPFVGFNEGAPILGINDSWSASMGCKALQTGDELVGLQTWQ